MIPDKIPPHNTEAEQAILGAILLEPKAIYDVNLKPDDFYKEAHRQIFKAMRKIREKGIDFITLTETLQIDGQLETAGGATYLSYLANETPTSANIKKHAEIVKTKALYRRIIQAAMQVIQAGYEEAPVDRLGRIMRLAFEDSSETLGTKHIKEILPGVLEYIERRYKHKIVVSGVPSGFAGLDMLTDGFHPELYILGGRSSHGKSALVKDFAVNAAMEGYQIHIVNIEDGNQNTIRRLIAKDADVALWQLRKGELNEFELQRIVSSVGSLAELPITFDDTIRSIEPICNSIRRAVEDGAKEIIVDYLQLIKGDKTRSRHEEIGEILQTLKELCKPSNLNVPIIVPCQLLREIDKRKVQRPMISDLKESGDIENHADVVMLLHRPGAYKHGTTGPEDADLIIAKGRNIGTGNVKLTFIKEKTTFQDREE